MRLLHQETILVDFCILVNKFGVCNVIFFAFFSSFFFSIIFDAIAMDIQIAVVLI